LGLFKRFKDKDSELLSEKEKEQQKLEAQFPRHLQAGRFFSKGTPAWQKSPTV
jgi:hypothetical protein